jgi:hypothetical protein
VAEHTAEENGRGCSVSESYVPMIAGGDCGMTNGDHEPSRGSLVASSDLNADHDAHVPVKMRRPDDVIADLEVSEPQLHVVSSEEPVSLLEAQADPRWRETMKEELDSIEDNQTWILCDLPQGRRAICLK